MFQVMNQRQLIKKILLEFVNEQDDEYQDIALDNLSKVGDFSKLREIDKLTLLGRSGDVNKTKRLFLSRMYDEKGNTFGMLEIKVKVKDINEQPIDNKFSKEFAGQEGYLLPAIQYFDNIPYVSVKFKEFESIDSHVAGGDYKSRFIPLANVYPISHDKIDDEFVKHQEKIDQGRKRFRDMFGLDEF
jgi:hypothetical protein